MNGWEILQIGQLLAIIIIYGLIFKQEFWPKPKPLKTWRVFFKIVKNHDYENTKEECHIIAATSAKEAIKDLRKIKNCVPPTFLYLTWIEEYYQ